MPAPESFQKQHGTNQQMPNVRIASADGYHSSVCVYINGLRNIHGEIRTVRVFSEAEGILICASKAYSVCVLRIIRHSSVCVYIYGLKNIHKKIRAVHVFREVKVLCFSASEAYSVFVLRIIRLHLYLYPYITCICTRHSEVLYSLYLVSCSYSFCIHIRIRIPFRTHIRIFIRIVILTPIGLLIRIRIRIRIRLCAFVSGRCGRETKEERRSSKTQPQ
jgi:hypothetical protein